MPTSVRAKSEFYTLGGLGIAPNNQLMAVAEDYLSRRQYGLRFCDLSNGEWYPEILENVTSGFAWSNDSRFVWYVRKHPTTLLPYQVWRHTVGTPAQSDALSLTRKKMRPFYVSVHKTTSPAVRGNLSLQRHHQRSAAAQRRTARRRAGLLSATA
ncbi:hypothetical protein LNQ03_31695 [Klebsiella pneumoniae subsp. pneumoniae]|nr:hypothetical protein [Klebsiella pneumoniae subsp. pneumoniae]